MAKEKVQTSIVTVVSLCGSSDDGYRIAMQRIDGCMATLITLAVITKAGMNYIPSHVLSKMLELSGRLVTEERLVTGDKVKRIQHEN